MTTSTCKVTVTAQYFNEMGRPKGGQIFVMDVNSDVFSYSRNEAEILQSMINDWQTKHNYSGRYVYLSHEVNFFGEVKLDGADYVAKEQAINAATERKEIPEPSQDEVSEMLHEAAKSILRQSK